MDITSYNLQGSSTKEVVAMAYVPWQKFTNTYEPQRALMAGTIFPELDKPFLGRKVGM